MTDRDLGIWTEVGRVMSRLGATQAYQLGAGVGVMFPRFTLETQVYPTRGVVSVGSDSKGTSMFKLSTAVDEPRAFSITLHGAARGGAVGTFTPMTGDVLKITFAPVPDRADGVDTAELTRRYVLGLAYLLDDDRFRHMLDLPPGQRSGQSLESHVLKLLG